MTGKMISSNEAKHASRNPLMRIALENFHRHVRALIPTDVNSICEIGTGEGFSAEAVFRDGAHTTLTGCDISLDAVQQAKYRLPEMKLLQSDAAQLPFSTRAFDLIVSLEVLEHLTEPAAAVGEFMRVSKRYLLLSVPNDPVFRTLRLATGKGWDQLGDHPEHVQHWTAPSFQKFLAAQGLYIKKVSVPFPYAWTIVLAICPQKR